MDDVKSVAPETEFVKSERRLQESEERYRLLVDNIKDYAIFLLDTNGIVLTWNPGAEQINGYKADEIIGQSFQNFYTKEDRDRRHPQRELEVAKEFGRYEEEGWRVRKDGGLFWANVVITRLDDRHGVHIGFTKITRDLTERRKAEEALRESEERFRLVVDSVRDYAIMMLDPEGRIMSWNEGARRLNGYEASEIIGKHLSIFYDSEDLESGKSEYELREATMTGRFEDEGWRVRKDGTKFWANVVVTALRGPKGDLRGFVKVTRDLTERKRAEDRLRLAHRSLEKRVAERTIALQRAVEARDEFLSIASHELRTPLTVLRLQQQIFERQIAKANGASPSPEVIRNVSDMAKRQIQQLSRLVEDMLDVSRIATGRLRLETSECDLSELLTSVLETFTEQLQAAGVQTRIDAESGLKAECDPQRIEQVIANLISNAIKYGGGAPLKISARRETQHIEIVVEDEGPGISEEDRERIFQRFERAVPAGESSGLGLGLYISRQIIESHGGTIRVESEAKKGSRFIVCLPIHPKALR